MDAAQAPVRWSVQPTESCIVGTYEAASCRYARYADAREDEQLYGEQDGA